jgi:hypothetical protein
MWSSLTSIPSDLAKRTGLFRSTQGYIPIALQVMDSEKTAAAANRESLAKTDGTHDDPELEKGTGSVEGEEVEGRHVTHEERLLLAKLDAVILPLTALLYLSAYLDRGNIGNARLQGLQASPPRST